LDDAGFPISRAVTFAIDRASPRYARHLDRRSIMRRLASAAGSLGSASGYLFETCEALRSRNLADPELFRLVEEVRLASRKT
jgi:cation transport protein ChaC